MNVLEILTKLWEFTNKIKSPEVAFFIASVTGVLISASYWKVYEELTREIWILQAFALLLLVLAWLSCNFKKRRAWRPVVVFGVLSLVVLIYTASPWYLFFWPVLYFVCGFFVSLIRGGINDETS